MCCCVTSLKYLYKNLFNVVKKQIVTLLVLANFLYKKKTKLNSRYKNS